MTMIGEIYLRAGTGMVSTSNTLRVNVNNPSIEDAVPYLLESIRENRSSGIYGGTSSLSHVPELGVD